MADAGNPSIMVRLLLIRTDSTTPVQTLHIDEGRAEQDKSREEERLRGGDSYTSRN